MKLHDQGPICSSGKRGFPTEEAAAQALRASSYTREPSQADPHRGGGAEQGHYRCAACEWWHLTSTAGRSRRGQLTDKRRGRGRR